MIKDWNLNAIGVIEAFSWLLGSAMLIFFFGQTALSESNRLNDLEEFNSSIEQHLTSPYISAPYINDDYQQPTPTFEDWDQARIEAYKASLKQQSAPVLAVLSIPSVKLEVPVYENASDLQMDRGVGRIAGTAFPDEGGNFGIAGHRDGYFRVLKDVRVGDPLQLKTPDGIKNYHIEKIFIIEPDDLQVLRNTDTDSITLVTCYPFYFVGHAPQRYIVRASLDDPSVN